MHAVTHTPIHPDGGKPLNRVVRLPDEPFLADYTWDPQTGVGIFVYAIAEPDSHEHVVHREQPHGRRHGGWRWFNGRYTPSSR